MIQTQPQKHQQWHLNASRKMYGTALYIWFVKMAFWKQRSTHVPHYWIWSRPSLRALAITVTHLGQVKSITWMLVRLHTGELQLPAWFHMLERQQRHLEAAIRSTAAVMTSVKFKDMPLVCFSYIYLNLFICFIGRIEVANGVIFLSRIWTK